MKSRRGVTLIMVAAVLAVLAALATGFYMMMLMETRAATRYADSVRADFAAKAGIQYAIGHLRAEAFVRTEDPSCAWFQVDYLRGATKRISFPDSPLLRNGADDDGDGVADNLEEALIDPTKVAGYSKALGDSAGKDSDRFALNITDAAGKINVNACDNLGVALDNLCRVIGAPLIAANLDAIQPRRWAIEAGADPVASFYDNSKNKNDTASNYNVYYTLTNSAGTVMTDGTGRPMRGTDGVAIYGDGYAIAGYRGRKGLFRNLEDIKQALTYVERNGNDTPDDPLEQLEIEVKFAAIRDHITISSWVDTNTVCVGKFEWIHIDTGSGGAGGGKTYAIDRDKSWVIDDPVNDPMNERGSLRGCYLSIVNGHGAGQLRRIRTNGIDWVEVEKGFAVTPGPTSSYMIVAPEEAMLMDIDGKQSSYSYPDKPPPAGAMTFPMTKSDGTLVRNPKMDYSIHPLCIHRAPVNVNTASDKVLAALFLGINVQHGHPLAVGTDADVVQLRKNWKTDDVHGVQPYLLTPAGLKRIPAASGKVTLNRTWGNGPMQVVPPPNVYDVAYINNNDTLGTPNYLIGTSPGPGLMTEAHELAYRIIMARQADLVNPALKYVDPITGGPTSNAINGKTGLPNPLRGPFRTYDDLYARVVKPWDDKRVKDGWTDTNANGKMDDNDEYHNARLANLIMAHFNSNTDILKFNPNIEWIDRWSRNFTEQEPIMVYTNSGNGGATLTVDVPAADPIDSSSIPIYTAVRDPNAKGWDGQNAPPIGSGQKDNNGNYIVGAYITRNFRYKSDEMIDKSDLNRSTTEFSFDSNGIFEIISTGQVAKSNEVLAERKFVALVKVYDVWRESTQQQFVQGTISKAMGSRQDAKNSEQLAFTGQLARDASGKVEPKGLVTLPEPLLPLQTKVADYTDGTAKLNTNNKELVTPIGGGSTDPLDAFGRPRQNPYDPGAQPIEVPEVLANRVLPARWDGQIVLATNTSAYDPNGDVDSFLATFDGDLDTATCKGNGREQAKWPYSAEPDNSGSFQYTKNNAKRPDGTPVSGSELRCVQGIGLLGALFDRLIASDPGIPLYDGITPYKDFAADQDKVRWIYPFFGISSALMPLNMGSDPERPFYWNNITVRMGSLRTDGAYLAGPGVSGNTATLKYLYSNKTNFNPDSPEGNCITMWAKTVWHHDDNRNHEFLNPGNVTRTGQCGGVWFQKMGQYKWCSANLSTGLGHCGNRRDLNDLSAMMMYENGSGYGSSVHGGYAGVDAKKYPDEAPGFRVQPFRWSFLGYRAFYRTSAEQPKASISPRGHFASSDDWANGYHVPIVSHYIRPFIDSEVFPELETSWGSPADGAKLRWSYQGWDNWNKGAQNTIGNTGNVEGASSARYGYGQDAKWIWAEPYGQGNSNDKVFTINNLNYGNPKYNQPFDKNNGVGCCALLWHYRQTPEDGTYAVIDELKISNKDRVLADGGADWANDRVTREMQISRYYLPPKAGSRIAPEQGGPPTFTSQTMLQSLKGFDVDKSKDTQNVAVVRVSWNVFTPRFMCEYKKPGLASFNRIEKHGHFASTGDAQAPVSIQYKGPFDYVRYNDDFFNDDTNVDSNGMLNKYYSVNRPGPWEYKTGLVQSGRGVEIELLKDNNGTISLLGNKIFTDPAATNGVGTPDKPEWCLPSQLRYRVRFCYPVDPLVDPFAAAKDAAGHPCVDPNRQYLLDTPVFDDISVTYITPPRILAFREMAE